MNFVGYFFPSDSALPITDIRFTALHFTSVSIEWTLQTNSQCGSGFHIKIASSRDVNVLSTITLFTSVNVTGLSRAIEYNITVFGISDDNEITGTN